MSHLISRFVSEDEVEEVRKIRQAEWERTRRPDDPIERPEAPYDPRSLYERLNEQRVKKQEEFEEKLKFKNQIYKGLDEEEASFLEEYKAKQLEEEDKRWLEEGEAIREFRKKAEQTASISTANQPTSRFFQKKMEDTKARLSRQPKLLRSLVKQRTSRQNEQTAETKQDGNDRDDQKSIPLKVEEKGTNPASEKLGDNNLESHPTKRFKVSTGKSSSLVDYDSDCSSGSDVNNETQ